MATNIFSDQENEPNAPDVSNITLETLVGDDQKYKTADELAKAYVHADAHIENTKAKLAQLEAENKVLKELDESRRNKVEPPKAPDGQRQDDPPVVRQPDPKDDKDLSTLIREELDRSKEQDKFASNVNAVSEKLSVYYGGPKEAQKAVAAKAQELKVSTEWLMDVAGRSPAAFYGTLGIDQRSVNTPSSTGDVNTVAFGADKNRKNFRYYEEIRKTTPKTYYSAQMRKEMFEEASKQGDKFYT